MSRARRRALAVALIALAASQPASPAAAEPVPNLRVEREPPPRHLRIRPRAAQAAPAPDPAAPAAARTPMPAAPNVSATSPERIEGLEGVRDVLQPISFSINLGYQVDGARLSGRPALGGRRPIAGVDHADLRSYGFGEVFASARGLVASSLSTYFAARFQVARRLEAKADPNDPESEDRPLAPPIATWFERSGPELRTGWVEAKDFLPRGWGLRNLRVRLGDQFIYGPWIVHMLGGNLAYESSTLTISAYGGQRRADYQRELEDNQPIVIGAAFRFDLRGLTRKVPLAFAGEYLTLTESNASAQPAIETAQLQVDWRPREDIAVIAQQRWLEGELANQHVEVRTRYKDVTNLVFEVMRRFATDWRWDPTLVTRSAEITEAKRYLDLGPVVPQLLLSARGGTRIAENFDLSARVAAAPRLGENNPTEETFATSYFELAGAVEVRLRRQVGVGLSALWRNPERDEADRIIDLGGPQKQLPEGGSMGEEGFVEAGTTVRLTLGARRFSALVELYGRRTRYTRAYSDPTEELPGSDLRGGGRFTVDAWIGKRLRLFASYDLSSRLETAPEISGYKSLRLVASGVY
jgi:hypothetical protein